MRNIYVRLNIEIKDRGRKLTRYLYNGRQSNNAGSAIYIFVKKQPTIGCIVIRSRNIGNWVTKAVKISLKYLVSEILSEDRDDYSLALFCVQAIIKIENQIQEKY